MIELNKAYGIGIEPFVAGRPDNQRPQRSPSAQSIRFDFAWGHIVENVDSDGLSWTLFALDKDEEGPGVEVAISLWEQCRKWLPAMVATLPLRAASRGEFARCFVGEESYSPALRLQLAVEVLSRFEDLLRSQLDRSADAATRLMDQISRT